MLSALHHQFQPTRDQRQALHRWNKFVLGDEYISEAAKKYPKSKEEKKKTQNIFNLRETLSEAEYVILKKPPEPAHRFEVTLDTNDFSEEKYTLFEQYQRLVHKEPPTKITKDGFKRFLCDSPIPITTRTHNGKDQKLGSYHQCYRLDGKLIALGVLDLLPQAVSSVYLIYDLEYEKYSFGKLSALREASLALEGGYEYYYMGFYIHSCKKMRYKNDYKPQYILDPDTNRWDLLDTVWKEKLDQPGFVSMSREIAGVEDNNGISPKHAQDHGLSPFDIGLPGSMKRQEIDETQLGSMILQIGPLGQYAHAEDIVGWNDGTINDGRASIKGTITELTACLGPEVAAKTIVDFTR